MVEGAKLPDSIMSGFMVYPYRISFLFAEKSDSTFEWWVSKKTFDEKPKEDVKDWVNHEHLMY